MLDGEHPLLAGRRDEAWLNALVFAGNANPIRAVTVGGRTLVEDGRHVAEVAVAEAYKRTLKELLS